LSSALLIGYKVHQLIVELCLILFPSGCSFVKYGVITSRPRIFTSSTNFSAPTRFLVESKKVGTTNVGTALTATASFALY